MYIKLPKSNKRFYLDNSTDYGKRLQIVNDAIAYRDNEILNYAVENNKIKSKSQLSSYTRACYMLENLATYLIGRDTGKFDILKPSKIKQVHNKELPVSIVSGNAYDLMYSGNASDDADNMSISASTVLTNKQPNTSIHRKNNGQLNTDKQREEKLKKRFRDTSTFKLNKLYNTKIIKTYHVVPVKNSDVTYLDGNKSQIHVAPPPSLFDDEGKINEKEFAKWKKKNAKNVFKNPILQDEIKYIGNKVGLIDPGQHYIANWCLVDTNGIFEFEGNTHIVSESYLPYQVNEKKSYDMDKILCVQLEGNTYFFNQNIDEIDDKYIKRITSA